MTAVGESGHSPLSAFVKGAIDEIEAIWSYIRATVDR